MGRTGSIVAIGGEDDAADDHAAVRIAIQEVRRPTRRVVIVPTASADPRRAVERAQDAFGRAGATAVEVVDVRTREEACDARTAARFADADLVYFTGGDEARLVGILGGSPTLGEIRRRHARGAVVAGSCAGATAMSRTMLARPAAVEGGMHKSEAPGSLGLGLLPSLVVDTHSTARGRYSRLLEVVMARPDLLGVGIGGGATVIVRNGRELEVVGDGLVVLVDGYEMRHTNFRQARAGQPVTAERLIVHTLGNGYRFDLLARAFGTRQAAKPAS